jgi:hypothetical protein
VGDGGVGASALSVQVARREADGYLQAEILLGGLASGKLLPGLGTLADNVHGVLLVLALAREGELVLGLAVWDLVDTEPLICGAEETGKVALDVLDIVELGGQWVVDVDDHDLPVGLALIEQSHDTEDLDLDHLTGLGDKLTNLADVQWVVVALGLGFLVDNIGVLPSLYSISTGVLSDIGVASSYLGEATVVPEVTLVGEAVPHVAELTLLDVLLDGVELLLLGDLLRRSAFSLRETVDWATAQAIGVNAPPSWRWSSGAPQRPC